MSKSHKKQNDISAFDKEVAQWVLTRLDATREEIARNHGHSIPEMEKLRVLIGFEMTSIIKG